VAIIPWLRGAFPGFIVGLEIVGPIDEIQKMARGDGR
jgi:hypothetical protein